MLDRHFIKAGLEKYAIMFRCRSCQADSSSNLESNPIKAGSQVMPSTLALGTMDDAFGLFVQVTSCQVFICPAPRR
jgi:hypothetical protein